jgi:hypothetical protein
LASAPAGDRVISIVHFLLLLIGTRSRSSSSRSAIVSMAVSAPTRRS